MMLKFYRQKNSALALWNSLSMQVRSLIWIVVAIIAMLVAVRLWGHDGQGTSSSTWYASPGDPYSAEAHPMWACVDVSRFPVGKPLELKNPPPISRSCGTHAQPPPKSETDDTSYVRYDSATNRYLFSRPLEEKGFRSTPGIDVSCECLGPCHRSQIAAPYCPQGVVCRNRFPQLEKYVSVDDAIAHPFRSRLILSRNMVNPGEILAYTDAYLERQTVVLSESFVQSLAVLPPSNSLYRHQRCAVVGHGGILINSSYGSIIDAYDAVFRMNENPLEMRPQDVGSRADYWLFSGQFTLDMLQSGGILWRLRQTNATAVYLWNMNRDMARIEELSKHDKSLKVIAIHPGYWMWFSDHRVDLYPPVAPNTWEWKVLHGEHTSMSGTISINLALEMCEHVDVYGFYGFVHSPIGLEAPYHWACPSPRAQLAGRLDYELLLMLASIDPPERRRLRVIL